MGRQRLRKGLLWAFWAGKRQDGLRQSGPQGWRWHPRRELACCLETGGAMLAPISGLDAVWDRENGQLSWLPHLAKPWGLTRHPCRLLPGLLALPRSSEPQVLCPTPKCHVTR